jgi:hypothetical protein
MQRVSRPLGARAGLQLRSNGDDFGPVPRASAAAILTARRPCRGPRFSVLGATLHQNGATRGRRQQIASRQLLASPCLHMGLCERFNHNLYTLTLEIDSIWSRAFQKPRPPSPAHHDRRRLTTSTTMAAHAPLLAAILLLLALGASPPAAARPLRVPFESRMLRGHGEGSAGVDQGLRAIGDRGGGRWDAGSERRSQARRSLPRARGAAGVRAPAAERARAARAFPAL